MNRIPVLLIDHGDITTAGLMHTLRELNFELDFKEVGTLPQVMPFIRQNPNCIVFVNLRPDKRTGFYLASNLLKENKNVKVILISSSYKNPLLGQLIHQGARAVLELDSPQKEYRDAFRSVVVGDRYLFGLQDMPILDNIALTPIEYQIITLISEGKTSKEISTLLNYTVKTVETYRSRIMKKLGAKNTSELISRFLQHYAHDALQVITSESDARA